MASATWLVCCGHEVGHRADDAAVELVHRVVPDEDLLGAGRLALHEGVERVAQHLLRLLAHGLQLAADLVLRRPVLFLRALGDVHRLVADPLQIGHEPQGSREEPQVVGHRLAQREDAQHERVDVHLVAVDVPVDLLDLRRQAAPTRPRTP